MGDNGRGKFKLVTVPGHSLIRGQMADYFKSKNPAPEGALMPASREEVMKKYDEWKKAQSTQRTFSKEIGTL